MTSHMYVFDENANADQAARANFRPERRVLGDLTNATMQNPSGLGKDAVLAKPVMRTQDTGVASRYAVAPVTAVPSRYSAAASLEQSQGMVRNLSGLMEEVLDLSLEDLEQQNSLRESSMAHMEPNEPDQVLLVRDYAPHLMDRMYEMEVQRQPSPAFMPKQKDLTPKMREILVDWLVEVHLKFRLQLETLFLTINLIDRFLERRAVSRTKLQLVGCTAMLIAAKYEEIYAPEVNDFVFISDKAYSREQILTMEAIMLNTLKFNLTAPSANRFSERYIQVALSTHPLQGEEKEVLINMVRFLTHLTLQDLNMMNFLPSLIAASSLKLASLLLNRPVCWTRTLQKHSRYNEAQLTECMQQIYALYLYDNPKYKAVRKKFLSRRYAGVSKMVFAPLNL